MIAIVHPLVREVHHEFEVLKSLISDLPNLYNRLVDEIEQHAKEDAEGAADGDPDIYSTVYHSYDYTIESVSEIPDQSRGYLHAAIYAFFERNLRNAYKYLGMANYCKASVVIDSAFTQCNVTITENQGLYDELKIFGLIRNNLSHGRLDKEDYWQRLTEYVKNNPSLEMQDDTVCIQDGEFLLHELQIVDQFFDCVFKLNPIFKTKYLGGQTTEDTV
jgi:hypothetical protein